jgi:hypothetical protein
MPKRPRKRRGRPATGHDPILGVRVPAKIIKKIDQLAEALSVDRSIIVRRFLKQGVDGHSYLLPTYRGKGEVHKYIASAAASERARGAEAAAARAKPANKLAAEIKAQRAMETATEIASSLGDRITLRRAAKTSPPSRARERPSPATYKSQRGPRRLSDAEIKAAVDRAVARSRGGG